MAAAKEQKRIPSLDGLRAVAIVLVLADHASMSWAERTGAWWNPLVKTLIEGAYGTQVFILLSGFLITRLLIVEKQRSSTINVRGFYVRRIFRLLPALWALLLVTGVFVFVGWADASPREFAYAASLTWIYNFSHWNWPLSHLWSLSVDNQFYLFWPIALLLLPARWSVAMGAAIIALTPLARLGFNASDAGRFHLVCYIVQASRFDVLMLGALAAFAWESDYFHRALERVYAWKVHWLAIAVMLATGAWLANTARPLQAIRAGLPTLKNIALLLMMLQPVIHWRAWCGRLLNHAWAVHVGNLSYSLYLWQQLFLTPSEQRGIGITLARLGGLLIVAHLSYFCIERPFLNLRRRALPNAGRAPAQSRAAVQPMTVAAVA